MKLATIRTPDGTRAVRLDEDDAVEIGPTDIGELLQNAAWRQLVRAADGRCHRIHTLDYAPLVVRPEKIICVGLNYRAHILEMGRDLPEYPTLFAKFQRCLIGARDEIVLPAASVAIDWEAELGVVIGAPVRHASVDQAHDAIAGYTVINDITARDWQYRTPQWLQGKTFEATTPVGPWLVTDIEVGSRQLSCTVDGITVQLSDTSDLVFTPAEIISYVSTMITLIPGDIIATGTPGGVGHARLPPQYLTAGQRIVTAIDGIGECDNLTHAEKRDSK